MSTLIVDVYNIYARSASKLGHLKTSDGRSSGGLFGFIRSVLAMQRQLDAQPVYLAFEGGGMAARQEIDSGYKADRSEKERWWHMEHIEEIAEWGRLIEGYVPVHADGCEADDVVASLVRDMLREDPSQTITIMSTDADFCKLLGPHVEMRHSVSEKPQTMQGFIDEHGYAPRYHFEVQCLAGCATDSVPGIMTDTKAAKLLSEHDWDLVNVLHTLSAADRERVEVVRQLVGFRHADVELRESSSTWDTLDDLYAGWEFNSLREKAA